MANSMKSQSPSTGKINLPKKYIEELKTVFSGLEGGEYKVFVFGSRVKNSSKANSDIDIGVKSDTGEKIDFDLFLNLKTKLDDTNIPYSMDLVDFDRADSDFVEQPFKNVYFLN